MNVGLVMLVFWSPTMPVSLVAVGFITNVVMIGATRVCKPRFWMKSCGRRLAVAGRERAGVVAEERVADQVGHARARAGLGSSTTIAYLSDGISVWGKLAVVERHRVMVVGL